MQFFQQKKQKRLILKRLKKTESWGSKKFRSTVKPFLSSEGFIHNNDITIEIDNKIIEDKSELNKTFTLN